MDAGDCCAGGKNLAIDGGGVAGYSRRRGVHLLLDIGTFVQHILLLKSDEMKAESIEYLPNHTGWYLL